jgi:hypothetical protein
MKSMAAYYAFIAMNSQQQDANRHRARVAEPRPARPSLLSRIRGQVGSSRTHRAAVKPV